MDRLVGDHRPCRLRPPSGAFSPRWCAATGSGSAWKSLGVKVAGGSTVSGFTALSAPTSSLPGAVDAVPRCAFLLPPGGGTGPPRPRRDCQPGRTVLSASQPRRVVQGGDRLTYTRRKGSAAMSATHPTRLETRTKESNACASQRVLRNPAA